MKELAKIFILMCIVSIMTSCSTQKSGMVCQGLKAHPNYTHNWR
jgi:hypothetical protein